MKLAVTLCLCTTIFVLGVLTHFAITATAIRVRVYPQQGFAPLSLRATVELEPDASDRWLWLLACDQTEDRCDRESAVTSSQKYIEGPQAAKVYEFGDPVTGRPWTILPAGNYLIVAAVGPSESLWRAHATTPVRVIGDP